MCDYGIVPGWSVVMSDLITGFAYLGIPVALLIIWRRAGLLGSILAVPGIGVSTFVLLCGIHHMIRGFSGLCLVMLWPCPPLERIHTFTMLAMAGVSVAVLIFLVAFRREIAEVLKRAG